MRGQIGGLLAALAIVGACRDASPPCDHAALEAGASRLESAQGEEVDALLGVVTRACPAIPTALTRYVDCSVLDGVSDDDCTVAAFRGPAVEAFQRRTCPNREALAPIGMLPASERDRKYYEICDLQRFGLLDEGETFYFRTDLALFHLAGWLSEAGVDRALMRRAIRTAMVAAADPSTLEVRCRQEGSDACRALVRAHEVDLPPMQGGAGNARRGTPVFVNAAAIVMADQIVVPLRGGIPDAGAVSGHLITPLGDRLAALGAPPDGAPRLLAIYADRDTPMGTLIDILFTADRHGMGTVEVVGDQRTTPASLRVAAPRRWQGKEAGTTEVRVVIDKGTVHVGTRPAIDITDSVALQAAIRDALDPRPDAPAFADRAVLELGVARDDRWGDVLGVVNTMQGPECSGSSGCWVPSLVLGQQPRFGPPGYESLEAEIEPWRSPDAPKPTRETRRLEALVEAALPQLTKCVRTADDFRDDNGALFWVEFDPAFAEGRRVRLIAGKSPALVACLERAIVLPRGKGPRQAHRVTVAATVRRRDRPSPSG